MSDETVGMLKNILKNIHKPCVVDADALSIIAAHHLILVFATKKHNLPSSKRVWTAFRMYSFNILNALWKRNK